MASKSPARRQTLDHLSQTYGFTLEFIESGFPEDLPKEGLSALEYVKRTAKGKLDCITSQYVVITGDTIIVRDGVILEKPASKEEAMSWFKSYRCIDCISVAWIREGDKQECIAETSKIYFRENLTEDQIEGYFEAMPSYKDKAGAIDIDECISRGMIEGSISQGDLHCIHGFPLSSFKSLIEK